MVICVAHTTVFRLGTRTASGASTWRKIWGYGRPPSNTKTHRKGLASGFSGGLGCCRPCKTDHPGRAQLCNSEMNAEIDSTFALSKVEHLI